MLKEVVCKRESPTGFGARRESFLVLKCNISTLMTIALLHPRQTTFTTSTSSTLQARRPRPSPLVPNQIEPIHPVPTPTQVQSSNIPIYGPASKWTSAINEFEMDCDMAPKAKFRRPCHCPLQTHRSQYSNLDPVGGSCGHRLRIFLNHHFLTLHEG